MTFFSPHHTLLDLINSFVENTVYSLSIGCEYLFLSSMLYTISTKYPPVIPISLIETHDRIHISTASIMITFVSIYYIISQSTWGTL